MRVRSSPVVWALVVAIGLAARPAAVVAADAATSAAPAEDVDPLALAAVLIGDGHHDRAAQVLERVDEAREDLDRARFYTLRGLVRLALGDADPARADLERAVAAGQDKPVVYVYLAQAAFATADYEGTLEAAARAGDAGAGLPALALMRADSLAHLERPAQAWAVLESASRRFPDAVEIERRKVLLLLELGLYRSAADVGARFVESGRATRADEIALGRAFRKSGDVAQAVRFLEASHLAHPAASDVLVELAGAYVDQGRPATAAALLERAAVADPDLLDDTAELFRRAHQPYRALNLNAEIRDQRVKLEQRLAILLDLERFDLVTGLERNLARAGLLDDAEVRYALAYSEFQGGDYEAAERHLSAIVEPGVLSKAAELRKVMEGCRGQRWKCS